VQLQGYLLSVGQLGADQAVPVETLVLPPVPDEVPPVLPMNDPRPPVLVLLLAPPVPVEADTAGHAQTPFSHVAQSLPGHGQQAVVSLLEQVAPTALQVWH
jgi:hypothetical protein